MIKLFVGLGNPGPEYEATRHNAGFWWIDALARELKTSLQPEKSYFGLVARAVVDGEARWLLKPQTFMNLSGKSVGALARFFKIQPSEILVVHDELDIVPGQAKLKLGGSHAGHNGLRDIHAQLGSPDYWRLRIGIGHPGAKDEVLNWVLKKPSADHRTAIEDSMTRAILAVPALMAGDMDKATMAIHTTKPPRPKPVRPPEPV
ncbi:MAG: aminoacyl-tRNA hydrolase [Ferruginibacter sp.]|nr:aminoacyl-tRNA hydrolase [Rhodoferax sp.]